jgi:hypothetical protein
LPGFHGCTARDRPQLARIFHSGDRATFKTVSHYKGHLRAAFSPSLNLYQTGFFERPQRTAFCIGLDAPVLHHQVGNNESVGLT